MLSQRVVENFFKRGRLRRSKRRSSIRSSLIKKETRISKPAEDAKQEKLGGDQLVKDQITQSAGMSASASNATERPTPQGTATSVPKPANGITSVPLSKEMASGCSTEKTDDPNLPSSQQSLCQPSSSSSSSSSSQLLTHLPTSQPASAASEVSRCQSSSADTKIVEMLKKEVDKLKKELSASKESLTKAQEREKALRNRLSEQAQRQLQKGSSKFEDLSLGDSRPTQLIKRYGNLYTESRLDAMDALDDVPNMADCEDLKVKLLLSVVVLAFRSAEKSLNEIKTKIRELLHIPRVIEGGNSSFCHAAKEVEEAVAFYLRKTVDKYDISKNYKEVCERVWTTLFDYPMLQQCQGLLRYIDDCMRVAWALSVQNPSFVIDFESSIFNPDTHTRFHTSDAGSSVVKYVLWPMLLEGEKGPCVSKGVVLT